MKLQARLTGQGKTDARLRMDKGSVAKAVLERLGGLEWQCSCEGTAGAGTN